MSAPRLRTAAAINEAWRERDAEYAGDRWSAWETFPYGAGEHAALAARLHNKGLLYAINLLALHPFGLALGVIRSDDEVRRGEYRQQDAQALYLARGIKGAVLGFDELSHREGMAKIGDRELSALLTGVREAEARLTRELERRRQM